MSAVRYRVPEIHHNETLKGKDDKGEDIVVHGSVHHPEMREFAGLVTRSHDDDTHDLVIFPPDRPPVHVHGVREGVGHGTFSHEGRRRKDETDGKKKD